MHNIINRLDCLIQVILSNTLTPETTIGTIVYVILGWAEC